MKLHRMITLSALAATLTLSATSLLAQDNPAPGGDQANGQGGGQRRNRQGGGPGGNWDPAQMQQRMVDGARDRLDFTNDTEWAAVEPLVKKVLAARMDVGMGGMRGMMGGRTRGGSTGDQAGGNRSRTSMFGQTSPEQEALQKALDDNAPVSQIKGLLAKYKAVQQAKQAKLEAAQAELKTYLSTKQEAQAFLLGLVN